MSSGPIESVLDRALAARSGMFDPGHETALRLFNGFLEGCPDLCVDLYARTLVLHDYATQADAGRGLVQETVAFLRTRLPWLSCGIVKTRRAPSAAEKRGTLLFGTTPDTQVREHGVCYSMDLTMNRDASLYLDTRELRLWASKNLRNKSVLNAFAYTGSLGVAALAGGAADVVQLDLNRRFLEVAKRSCRLNGLPVDERKFLAGNFFPQISRLKRRGQLFDCVLLDPPFFASSASGTVDLAANSARLINKVRPLIADGGYLVAINNALFVSGAEYMRTLDTLCADGYLNIETLIPVPTDFTGFPETIVGTPITESAPFNHSTKIAVLRVKRKNPS